MDEIPQVSSNHLDYGGCPTIADQEGQATQDSQVSALEESDDSTDTTMPQVIPRQLNGTHRINGDTAVPRQGPPVNTAATILNALIDVPHESDAANVPPEYVARTPMVAEPDMQQFVTSAPLLRDMTAPHPPPVVLSRQEWMSRRNSRVALNNWPHGIMSTNSGQNQQGRTTLSSWHDAQPSDEPYLIIGEIDHLGPSPVFNHSATNGGPGSDIGAVAGSSPRSPEQAD